MTIMDNEISNADLQRMLAENPLAAEQLRRIVAERQRDEAIAALAAQNGDVLQETAVVKAV